MPRLATAVHLVHPLTRERIILLPGQEPPAELAVLVRHPAAWDDGQAPPAPGKKPEAGSEGRGRRPAPRRRSKPVE